MIKLYSPINWKVSWYILRIYHKIQYGGSIMANGKLINYLILMKIGFWGFFGLLNTTPPSDFQNALWWRKNLKKYRMFRKFGIWGFWVSLIIIQQRVFKIQRGRSSTVDWRRKFTQFWRKLVSYVFLELLNTNLFLYSWNSRSRIQYSERKIEVIHCWSKLVCRDSTFLEVINEKLTMNQ